MQIDVQGKRVQVATGGQSTPSGDVTVVLLHGAGNDRTVWQLQTRWLAHHGYRVFAPDLPGHGHSEGPPAGSIGELADWVASFLDAAGAAPAHVVGHSMGSLAALELAARHPDHVAGIVLLGVTPKMGVHPDLLTAAVDDVDLAAQLISSWSLAPDNQIGDHPAPGMWMRGGVQAMLATCPPGTLAAGLEICAAYDNALDAAASITCPVTAVLGADDKMTPARTAVPLLDQLATIQTHTLPGAGHNVMTEQPDEVLRILQSALR